MPVQNAEARSMDPDRIKGPSQTPRDVLIGGGAQQGDFLGLPYIGVRSARIDRADMQLAPTLLDTRQAASNPFRYLAVRHGAEQFVVSRVPMVNFGARHGQPHRNSP